MLRNLNNLITIIIAICTFVPISLWSQSNNILLVFLGDSNSGGHAENSHASADELKENFKLQIWDNKSNAKFINYNPLKHSLVEHDGLSTKGYNGCRHGWDLNLSQEILTGNYKQSNIFLLKAGQGGTRIEHWINDLPYESLKPWSTFVTRYSNAVKSIERNFGKCKVVVWVSIGINDARDQISSEIFLRNLGLFKDKLSKLVGGSPVIFAKIPRVDSHFNALDDCIEHFCKSNKGYYSIDTYGASLSNDLLHWDYNGMKLISKRLSEKTRTILNIK